MFSKVGVHVKDNSEAQWQVLREGSNQLVFPRSYLHRSALGT